VAGSIAEHPGVSVRPWVLAEAYDQNGELAAEATQYSRARQFDRGSFGPKGPAVRVLSFAPRPPSRSLPEGPDSVSNAFPGRQLDAVEEVVRFLLDGSLQAVDAAPDPETWPLVVTPARHRGPPE
jgi:hypothetical protein